MKNYNSIDLMKFVMALCVVTIHTYIVDGMNPSFLRDILHSLIRNAVPFFFITSSFSRFIIKNEEVMKKKGTAFRIKECNMSLKKDGFIPSTIYV